MSNSETLMPAVTKYLGQGWAQTQAVGLAWADYFQGIYDEFARLHPKIKDVIEFEFTCYCFTCKGGGRYKKPFQVRSFIRLHKGHDTKTFVGPESETF